MNNITKVLTGELFRVMATWFGSYITNKFRVALLSANNSINTTKEQAIASVNTTRDQAIADMNSAKTSAVTTIIDTKDSAVSTINTAKDQALAAVSIVNTGSATNVEEIYNYFSTNPGSSSTTVTQQWPGDSEAVSHTVYRNTMYV